MAYSDYGSFVYLNGLRQRDHEDVAVYNNAEAELPSGARIYNNIIRNIQENTKDKCEFDQMSERCHHGVLGNGDIRVAVYKEGITSTLIFDRKNQKIYYADDIIKLAGKDIAPSSKQNCKEYIKCYYKDYNYTVEIEGHKMTFSEVFNANVTRPLFKATMTTPDGDEWVCFYGSQYGAGLIDCYDNEHDFDKLEEDLPGYWKELVLNYIITGVSDSENELEGKNSIIYNGNKIWYNGEDYYIPAHILNVDNTRSTLYNNSFLDPEDFIDILNMGIKLAKEGYTHVSSGDVEIGGVNQNWDYNDEFEDDIKFLETKKEFEEHRILINKRWEDEESREENANDS